MESGRTRREKGSSHKGYIRAHLFMRLFAFAATLGAAVCMALNKQTTDIGGYQIAANYKSSPAFVFLVVSNGLASAYSLLSVFFVSNLVEGYMLHLLDLIIKVLLMAAAAAASAIAYLGKKGNTHTGWLSVCPYYEKFCNRAGISLALSYIGFLLFLIMCALTSMHKTRLINNL